MKRYNIAVFLLAFCLNIGAMEEKKEAKKRKFCIYQTIDLLGKPTVDEYGIPCNEIIRKVSIKSIGALPVMFSFNMGQEFGPITYPITKFTQPIHKQKYIKGKDDATILQLTFNVQQPDNVYNITIPKDVEELDLNIVNGSVIFRVVEALITACGPKVIIERRTKKDSYTKAESGKCDENQQKETYTFFQPGESFAEKEGKQSRKVNLVVPKGRVMLGSLKRQPKKEIVLHTNAPTQ